MSLLRILVLVSLASIPSATLAGDLFDVPHTRAALFEHQIGVIERRGGLEIEVVTKATAPMTVARAAPSPIKLEKASLRGPHLQMYVSAAKAAARRHGIHESLFLSLVQQESGWNRNAKSPVGAIGFAQLMPGTARDLNVDPHDPIQNLEGGARYLRQQFDRFGDWRLALAAYNAGPGAVKKYGGIPPYNETRNYVRKIADPLGL